MDRARGQPVGRVWSSGRQPWPDTHTGSWRRWGLRSGWDRKCFQGRGSCVMQRRVLEDAGVPRVGVGSRVRRTKGSGKGCQRGDRQSFKAHYGGLTEVRGRGSWAVQ